MIDFTCANKVNVRRKSASQQSPKILDVGSEYEETKEAPGGGSVQHVGFGFLGHSDIVEVCGVQLNGGRGRFSILKCTSLPCLVQDCSSDDRLARPPAMERGDRKGAKIVLS